MAEEKCIFCQICAHKAPAQILYEDEEFVVFKDIKPVAKHHYLVIPKKHIKGANVLTKSDLPMLEKMHEVGKNVLKDAGGSIEEAQFGFHWPPFNTVNHIHLHVISPISDMGFCHRQMFKPDTFWFVTIDYMYNRLSKL